MRVTALCLPERSLSTVLRTERKAHARGRPIAIILIFLPPPQSMDDKAHELSSLPALPTVPATVSAGSRVALPDDAAIIRARDRVNGGRLAWLALIGTWLISFVRSALLGEG